MHAWGVCGPGSIPGSPTWGLGIRRGVFLLGGTSHNPFRAPMYRSCQVGIGCIAKLRSL